MVESGFSKWSDRIRTVFGTRICTAWYRQSFSLNTFYLISGTKSPWHLISSISARFTITKQQQRKYLDTVLGHAGFLNWRTKIWRLCLKLFTVEEFPARGESEENVHSDRKRISINRSLNISEAGERSEKIYPMMIEQKSFLTLTKQIRLSARTFIFGILKIPMNRKSEPDFTTMIWKSYSINLLGTRKFPSVFSILYNLPESPGTPLFKICDLHSGTNLLQSVIWFVDVLWICVNWRLCFVHRHVVTWIQTRCDLFADTDQIQSLFLPCSIHPWEGTFFKLFVKIKIRNPNTRPYDLD